VTLRREEPPPDGRPGAADPPDGSPPDGSPPHAGLLRPGLLPPDLMPPVPADAGSDPAPRPAVRVQDHLSARVRRPIDLLRFIVDVTQIVLVAGIALAARAATTGTEFDILRATNGLPHPLLDIAHPLAPIALLALPVALAIRQIFRRQLRQLAEAVATGVLAAMAVAFANFLLHTSSAQVLYDAITMTHPGASHLAPLDPSLAGLAAYTTIIGLSGRPRWRAAVWITVGAYSLVRLVGGETTVLALPITLLAGRAIGLAVRYVFGYRSQRPSATEIARALGQPGRAVTGMRRLPGNNSGSRQYAATVQDGSQFDVTVLDRDQQAAGLIYRLYRSVRLQAQVSRSAVLSLNRTVERRALLSYAATQAGVRTPTLRAVVRAGPEGIAFGYDHHPGVTLAELQPGPTDAQLVSAWDQVLQLHEHRITHRSLIASQLLLTSDGQVMLLGLGNGDVAASDLQVRLDVAQLVAEFALLVGAERSADIALELHRTTRAALRHHKDVLPAVRKQLLGEIQRDVAAPVQLERIRPRTLVTLIAAVAAVYLLAGQLASVDLRTLFRSADWRWSIVALGLSALTYLGAAWSLSGFVLERLRLARTCLVQVAGSFVTLVTPAAVGGVALNVRYLRRSGVSAADSAASVGASQVVTFVLHLSLLVVFAAISGTADEHSLQPPHWVFFVIGGLVIVALAIVAVPPGRRLLRARIAPMLGQVIPRLLDVAQQPVKLAEGIGGTLLLTIGYILCLDASVKALGGSVALASVAVVYLTGSAVGSIVPTPGGLGAVEAALSAGLTAAGLHGATAVSAVLLFRILTFWLPVPVGWGALSYLQRKDAL
jgi:uncharacterized membrane protein YbhN (UPF0104 family)